MNSAFVQRLKFDFWTFHDYSREPLDILRGRTLGAGAKAHEGPAALA